LNFGKLLRWLITGINLAARGYQTFDTLYLRVNLPERNKYF
jgi:hypothetical protein